MKSRRGVTSKDLARSSEAGKVQVLTAEDIAAFFAEEVRPGVRRVRSEIRRFPRSLLVRNKPLLLEHDLQDFLLVAFQRRAPMRPYVSPPRRRGRRAGVSKTEIALDNLLARANALASG